jgi:predicted acyltransferase
MKPERMMSNDQIRGFAILTMALANYMNIVIIIPALLKHPPDIGLTVIDLIAPFFIFAISLTYGLSFHHRLEREGAFKTYSQLFVPYKNIIISL